MTKNITILLRWESRIKTLGNHLFYLETRTLVRSSLSARLQNINPVMYNIKITPTTTNNVYPVFSNANEGVSKVFGAT